MLFPFGKIDVNPGTVLIETMLSGDPLYIGNIDVILSLQFTEFCIYCAHESMKKSPLYLSKIAEIYSTANSTRFAQYLLQIFALDRGRKWMMFFSISF